MEELVGYEIPVKFLEVDEERERLVFSNRRASAEGEVQVSIYLGCCIYITVH